MSHQYYAAILSATRSSAIALQRIASYSRMIRDAECIGDTAHAAQLYRSLAAAQRRYHTAQRILASHPLSADDIAARQADYPRAR